MSEDPVEFLLEELLDLAQTLLPFDKDRIIHIAQVLKRYRETPKKHPAPLDKP